MKQSLFFMSLFIALGCGLWGCPSGGQVKTGDNANPNKPPFALVTTGVGKYDRYFRRVYTLRTQLWKADRDLKSMPSVLKAALELPGDVKQTNLSSLLKTAATEYGSKLTFNGKGVVVREGVQDPKAVKVARSLDWIYKTSSDLPKNLSGATAESKALVKEGKALSKSAPKDFTGMNTLKLPRVSAQLAASTAEMTKVPAQVAALTVTAAGVAKQFPLVFAAQK